MLKIFIGVVALALATASFSAQVHHKDKTLHHAAMHAENWVHRHDSPSLSKKKHYPKRHGKDKSTHHAAMHAEHWLKGHASAPHKHN